MANPVLTGHHGTSRKTADMILAQGFTISRNSYDWLGDGAYFWQDAPLRALEWARIAFGAEGVVLEASIEIRDFINLLDTEWMSWLADVYDQYLREQKTAGKVLPVQTDKSHRLDREVINFGVSILEESGIPVKGVIGAFREGRPVFTNSALFTQSHVQIAVRDLSLVTNCRILAPKEIPDVRQIKDS
jgi:hypothetical protein